MIPQLVLGQGRVFPTKWTNRVRGFVRGMLGLGFCYCGIMSPHSRGQLPSLEATARPSDHLSSWQVLALRMFFRADGKIHHTQPTQSSPDMGIIRGSCLYTRVFIKTKHFFFPRVLGCVLKACQQKDLCGGKTLPKVKIGFAVLAHLFIFSVLQAVRVTCFSVQVPVSEGLALI